jgi:DNA invertase Pin-like site-specific DNA recombinase
MGRFFLTVMAGAAELEKNLIGERTAQTLQHKKANGERVGTVAYGKRLAADGIHLEDNAAEQDVIATAKIYAQHGLSLRKIAARLVDEGYMSRTGKPFTAQAISNMLEEVA